MVTHSDAAQHQEHSTESFTQRNTKNMKAGDNNLNEQGNQASGRWTAD